MLDGVGAAYFFIPQGGDTHSEDPRKERCACGFTTSDAHPVRLQGSPQKGSVHVFRPFCLGKGHCLCDTAVAMFMMRFTQLAGFAGFWLCGAQCDLTRVPRGYGSASPSCRIPPFPALFVSKDVMQQN